MVFNDFKEDCKIKKAIMDFSRKQNEFLIYIYCLEKDINVKKEKKKLEKLYFKHGLSYELCYGLVWWEPSTVTKIISIDPNYLSTYIFTFGKRPVDSFFLLI